MKLDKSFVFVKNIKRELVIIIFIFIFSFLVRLWNFNGMGRTWDEAPYVETGYNYIKLAKSLNFSDPFWYELSDAPPLARYLYGAVSKFDIKNFDKSGKPIYFYDYTAARLVATILSCLSIVFIYLIGRKFFSEFIGITGSLVFSLIPFYLGFSHAATLEAVIMFTYTGSLLFFLNFLNDNKKYNLIFTGIFFGLGLLTKFSNLLIYFSFITIYLVTLKLNKENIKIGKALVNLGLILLIGLLTTFILWPMAWFHPDSIWHVQHSMRFAAHTSIPEVFFGKLILVPIYYYPVMFLITTPLVLIVLSLFGMLKIDKKKTWIGISIIVWFLIPFFQTLYHMRQHGVRYIIEIYAPFSLLCAIGFDYFASRFTNKIKTKYMLFLPVIFYLLIINIKMSPYYLDYFNEVVGGNKYVYDHRLFQMGWWGQGVDEAIKYISENEKKNVTVAIDSTQTNQVVPEFQNIKIVYYDKKVLTDYVIVPYFSVVRLGFPENEVAVNYREVYSVKADGAEIVKVFRRKY